MRKNKGYWTKENCKKEVLKYSSRAEFKRGSGGAYNVAKKNGWLDELCEKMIYLGNRFKRCVYVYEFNDKSIYVGLTYNIEERDNKHKRANIQKTGLIPELTYTDYMDVEEAKIKEGILVEEFRKKDYKILNISKTGGVGGGYLKWTFEKCLEEALKYNSRKEFCVKNESAYNSARRYNWLDEICLHMNKKKTKSKGYWTEEKCLEEVLKYSTKSELYKNSPGAYMFMLRNNLLQQFCPNMKSKKPNGYWTKEKCKEEALKYSSKKEFIERNGSVYSISCSNGWMYEICEHMDKNKSI